MGLVSELYTAEVIRREKIIEKGKAEFGRRMKSPKRVTESIEGKGLGDLHYAPWEKFKP